MVSITVPAQTTNNQPPSSVSSAVLGSTASSVSLGSSTSAPATSSSPSPPQVYVFDAVFTLEHEQRLEKTRHPVQTGADISSHAYLMPARVTMNVGMSDAQASYTGPNVQAWSGSSSKSVSAYQRMIALQAARTLLTVTTRLRTYTNMVITSIGPSEDFRTITGLRMRIEFEQIFTASISSTPVSARPNDTQTTGLGAVNAQTPDSSLDSQYGILSSEPSVGTTPDSVQPSASGLQTVDVPGAGDFTSNIGQAAQP